MFVHTSSDLRILADRLAGIVSAPGLGVLEREVVLIQSSGMQRWLSRELAQRLGIAANLEFPFPRAFVRRTLAQVLAAEEEADRYERDVLAWEIFALLAEPPGGAEYDLVQRYLGSGGALARLALAEQLAHLYDQYLTYRPHLIFGWESGKGSADFQADLWRRLRERLGPHHLAARVRELLREVSDERIQAALPKRISLVGGPGLPPLYLEVLARLGRAIDVHVLSLLPASDYLGDLHPHDEPLPEVGRGAHPLLVSMGRLAADYQTLLLDLPHTEASSEFPLPEETTLLGALQRDVILASRRDEARRLPARSATDGTITLDSCHSRLREVEVLKDRLLGWFHEDPSLRPEDVVVLSPDIEAYSPLISAVFGARAEGGIKIPFRIADRSEGAVNAAARALLSGIRLLGGRLKASEMLDFLQSEPVTARFGLSMVDLERIGDWVTKAGIRFGADAAHLEELGLESSSAHTWQTGIARLLLGYALEDDGESLYSGLVPVDDVPAGEAELLGRFAEFVDGILRFRRRATGAGLLPREWQELLTDFTRAFLADGEEADWDVEAALLLALDACAAAVRVVPDERLGLDLVQHLLSAAQGEQKGSSDFLSYGVTFCALLPLRTIPFRRVCVLGLDQASFPRRDQPHELDQLSHAPKAGDRSLRAEDRQLFLEWILGARERLALSYVGRSIQDDTACPVSVVVTELTDVLCGMLEPGALPLVPRQHPLQPFSPRYFSPGSGFESFDAVAFSGASALVREPAGGRTRPAFFAEPLATPLPGPAAGGDGRLAVELKDLERFWKDPARGFLSRLRVVVDDDIQHFEDRETVSLDGLARYQLGESLLGRVERGLPIVREVELGRGQLPLGAAGEVELQGTLSLAAQLGLVADRLAGASAAQRLVVDLPLDLPSSEAPGGLFGVRLLGQARVRGDVQLEVAFKRASARAKLELWIRHLALCASGLFVETILLARPPAGRFGGKKAEAPVTVTLAPLEAELAKAELEKLVSGYLEGQRQPLCFSPEAALLLAKEHGKPLRRGQAPAAARALEKLRDDGGLFSEVFRDEDLRLGLSEARSLELERRSLDVFSPLLAVLKESPL